MTESQFQKYVLEAFKYHDNIMIWRNNTGVTKMDNKRFVRFGTPGSADIIGIIKHFRCQQCNASQNGIFLAIELKGSEGELQPSQQEWIDKVTEFNAIAFCLFPIETDPIGLRERIVKKCYSYTCGSCSK